ncbi:hypothetical protein Tco_1283586 [Tanacetum coccineum]
MSNAAIEQMIADRVDATIAVEQTAAAAKAAEVARAAATAGDARGYNSTGPAASAGGPNVAGPTIGDVAMNAVHEVRGCSYLEFMKCEPTKFKGTEGANVLSVTSLYGIRNKDLHDETERISKASKDVSNESKIADTVCNDAFEVTQELSKRIIELEKMDWCLSSYVLRQRVIGF